MHSSPLVLFLFVGEKVSFAKRIVLRRMRGLLVRVLSSLYSPVGQFTEEKKKNTTKELNCVYANSRATISGCSVDSWAYASVEKDPQGNNECLGRPSNLYGVSLQLFYVRFT